MKDKEVKKQKIPANNIQKCAEGIYIVNRYGPVKCATWLLVHGKECAIVEMPEYEEKEDMPAKMVEAKINEMGLIPKYAICSHHHLDHCQSIWDYRQTFPKTTFIAHKSFIDGYNNFIYLMQFVTGYRYLLLNKNYFEHIFEHDVYQCSLENEPLIFIHSPKHCESDIMIIFKGVMITSDWSIGYHPDCNNLVTPEQKIKSIDNLIKRLKDFNYKVHTLFSVHGNDFRHNIDFDKIMEETRKFALDESQRPSYTVNLMDNLLKDKPFSK